MSETLCEHCGEQIGAPHRLLPIDCILGHQAHAERFSGYACRRHYHWMNDTLRQIEELFALADDVLLPGPAQGGERHGTRDGSPAPGRLGMMALTDKRAKTPIDLEPDDVPDLPGTLTSWARLVLEERHSTRSASTVVEAIHVLIHERTFIAAQEWVDDYCTELAVLHRQLAGAVGDTMWPRPIGRCPNCQVGLFNTIGVDEVTCRRCKASWSGASLARLRLIHEQEQEASA